MRWLAEKIVDARGRLFNLYNRAVAFFKKKSTGTAILETVITLPIISYMVFFSIELIRIGQAQAAVDAITKEFTFYLMAKGKIVQSEVDGIFQKHKPAGIPIGHFRYIIHMYANFHTDDGKGVMDVSPYGGVNIEWLGQDYNSPTPNQSPTQRASTASYGRGNEGNQATLLKYQAGGVKNYADSKTLLEGNGSSSGYIFVLTVALNFPFSSSFVKKLFNGGTNTNRTGVYILWARGSGIIN